MSLGSSCFGHGGICSNSSLACWCEKLVLTPAELGIDSADTVGIEVDSVGDFTVRKDSGTEAGSKDSSDWKLEWLSNSRVDCGTIHPETMGQKNMSLSLRVSSSSNAKEKKHQNFKFKDHKFRSSSWGFRLMSLAHVCHLMKENRQVPKSDPGELGKASRPEKRLSWIRMLLLITLQEVDCFCVGLKQSSSSWQGLLQLLVPLSPRVPTRQYELYDRKFLPKIDGKGEPALILVMRSCLQVQPSFIPGCWRNADM